MERVKLLLIHTPIFEDGINIIDDYCYADYKSIFDDVLYEMYERFDEIREEFGMSWWHEAIYESQYAHPIDNFIKFDFGYPYVMINNTKQNKIKNIFLQYIYNN